MFENYHQISFDDLERLFKTGNYTGTYVLLDDRIVVFWGHESMRFQAHVSYSDILEMYWKSNTKISLKEAIKLFINAHLSSEQFFQSFLIKEEKDRLKERKLHLKTGLRKDVRDLNLIRPEDDATKKNSD